MRHSSVPGGPAGPALALCLALAAGPAPAADVVIPISNEQRVLLGIETAAAEPAAALDVDGLTGEIMLPVDASAAVAAPYAGRVLRVLVDEGDRVQAGQVLATVASRDFAEGHGRLARARAERDLARRQVRRDEQLLAEGIIAAARAETSRATLQALESEVQMLAGALGNVPSDGAGNAQFALRAPIDARVLNRRISAGEPIDALAVAFVLAANDAWRVELRVPAAIATRLTDGDVIRIGELSAPVAGHGLALDPATQTVKAWARLPSASGLLPGQRVSARLELRAPAGAMRIPRAAVVWHGPSALVYVAEPAGYREVPVEVLGQSATHATVTGALASGAQVVVNGTSALKSLAAN